MEDLSDHHEHAIEEDLREAVASEVDDRGALIRQLRVVEGGGEEDVHHPWRSDHQQHRDPSQEHHRQSHDPVGEGLAAVRVRLGRSHQLGDEDCVEDAACQQDVEHRGDRVRNGKQVTM